MKLLIFMILILTAACSSTQNIKTRKGFTAYTTMREMQEYKMEYKIRASLEPAPGQSRPKLNRLR